MPYIGLSMCHALLEGSTKFRTDTTTFLLKNILESERPQLKKHMESRSFQIRIWGP